MMGLTKDVTTPVMIKPSCCEAVRLKLSMYFYTAADEERVSHVGYDASRERKKPAPEAWKAGRMDWCYGRWFPSRKVDSGRRSRPNRMWWRYMQQKVPHRKHRTPSMPEERPELEMNSQEQTIKGMDPNGPREKRKWYLRAIAFGRWPGCMMWW